MRTIAILLTIAGLTAAAEDKSQSFTGVITDSMCGAKHDMMKDAPDGECVKMCVKESSDYALYDGHDVWKLSDGKKAAQFAAKKVVVTGKADEANKTIHVVSVIAAE